MKFFSELLNIRDCSDLTAKEGRLKSLLKAYRSDSIDIDHSSEVSAWRQPSSSEICTTVSGKDVQKRRKLDTDEGQAVFLHAIAHIEYSAIDLALDAAYRFRHLPAEYYSDWLKVAEDEFRHFNMLRGLLNRLGYDYGDFDVHRGLYNAAKRSEKSLAMRMAAVPRHMEAGGIDAGPLIQNKFRSFNDDFALEIVETLEIIYRDEIDHVSKGSRWFKYAAELENLTESDYFNLVEEAVPGGLKTNRKLNRAGRLQAGFTAGELDRLEQINSN